ncbi:MAG: hypothetical protein IJW78_01410 [Clostridia bacterium]|nr:hypothetical protein [Clostridia bacterium]
MQKKLGCPIVFYDSIDTSQFRLLLLENMIYMLSKKYAGIRVALVEHPEPDCLLKRIAPFSKEIHMIQSGKIDESYYLEKFGCAPVQMQFYGTQEIIYKYMQGKLYYRGKEVVLPENGYLLPIDVAEMMPNGISELAFMNLLWKFGGLKAETILPSDTVFKKL